MVSRANAPVMAGPRSTTLRRASAEARPAGVTVSTPVLWLAGLIAGLALVAAAAGLFWQVGTAPTTATTIRGEVVQLFGWGLYRYDTLFAGAGSRGTDAVTLLLGVPALGTAAALYRRGSLRAGLFLAGMFGYFLYVYASYALGTVAYNEFFLVYVAVFSASFYGLVALSMSLARQGALTPVAPRLPRRGPAAFMAVGGLVTLVVWLEPIVGALLQGQTPGPLGAQTTLFTHGLDLALIVPACFLSAWLIGRRDPLGYLIAFPLLGLILLLGPVIAAQTVSQLAAGVTFTPGEIIGPIGGFGLVAVFAIWVVVALLRSSARPRA